MKSKIMAHVLHTLSKAIRPQTPLDLLNVSPFKGEYKTQKIGTTSIRYTLKTLEKEELVERIDVDLVGSLYSFWRLTDIGREYIQHMVARGETQNRASPGENSISATTFSPSPHLNILLHNEGDQEGG